MARPGISYQDVSSAVHTLLEQGEKPTLARIRQLLGTGSLSTIAEHWRRWQHQQTEQSSTPELPEALQQAIHTLWQTAIEQAQNHYQAQCTELELAQNQFLEQQAHAQTQLEQLHTQLEQHTTRISELNTQREQLLQQLTSAQEQLRALQQQLQQAQLQQQQELQQRQAQFQQHLLQAEQRWLDERARGEASDTRWLAILDKERAERQSLGKLHSEERERLATQLRETQLNTQALHVELADTRAQLARAQANAASSETVGAALHAQLEQAQHQVQHWQAHCSALAAQLAGKDKREAEEKT